MILSKEKILFCLFQTTWHYTLTRSVQTHSSTWLSLSLVKPQLDDKTGCSFFLPSPKCYPWKASLQGISGSLLQLPCFALGRRGCAHLLVKVEHHGVKRWRHVFGVDAHGSETRSPVGVELVAALCDLVVYGGGLLSLAHIFNDHAQLKRKGQRWVTSSQKHGK